MTFDEYSKVIFGETSLTKEQIETNYKYSSPFAPATNIAHTSPPGTTPDGTADTIQLSICNKKQQSLHYIYLIFSKLYLYFKKRFSTFATAPTTFTSSRHARRGLL